MLYTCQQPFGLILHSQHTRSYVPQYGDELPMIRPKQHCASRQRSRLGVISNTVFAMYEEDVMRPV